MQQLILIILAATFLLFSGCSNQPSPKAEPTINTSLPLVKVNGHIESMTTIAFEWKPSTDAKVKGYYIYRNDSSDNPSELTRHEIVPNRYVSHFTDDDLKPNTTYIYRFSTYNKKAQESKTSKRYKVTTRPILPSVSFFDSIGNLPRMAKLIWRPHDNLLVKSYILERQTVESAKWEKIATIKNRLQAEYIDTDLDDNRVYKYRLRAVTYTKIKSLPSKIVKIVTKALPKEVQGLNASTTEVKSIKVSWTPLSETLVAFYKVYRSSSNEGSYNYYMKLNDTHFIDDIKEDGKTFYYKVTAVDNDDLEGALQVAPAQGSTLSKPKSPTLMEAVIKNGAAVLTWKANDNNVKSYTLIKTTKESWLKSTTIEITDIKKTSYTVADLTPDTQYQFQVIAVDTNEIRSLPTKAVDVLFSTPAR